jgi:hypothetical protein
LPFVDPFSLSSIDFRVSDRVLIVRVARDRNYLRDIISSAFSFLCVISVSWTISARSASPTGCLAALISKSQVFS